MLMPTLLQRVKVRGPDQVFVVSQIYPSLQVVDLLPLGASISLRAECRSTTSKLWRMRQRQHSRG